MTIVGRIAKRISEIFPDMTIYSEKQESGLQAPSLYINKIVTITESRFPDTQDRSLLYLITCFANPDRPNADMEKVEQRLLNNLAGLDDYVTIESQEATINQDSETLVMSFGLRLEIYSVQDSGKLERIEFNRRTQ